MKNCISLIIEEFYMNMLQKRSVMISFICQSGWAIESDNVAKLYYGCFCEDVFGRLTFRSVDFE